MKNKRTKKKGKRFSIKQQIPHLLGLNKKDKLALFLGAGVSYECGLPNWNDLLLNLQKKLVVKVGEDETNSCDDLANFGRKIFKEDFNYEISDILYSNTVTISPNLKAIANSGINKIVCFNFDDLLEEALSTESIRHRVVLNGETFNANYPRTLVFHPHGYIGRFDTKIEIQSSKIILSQSDYDTLYKDHYCLTNLIQLSIMMNHSVLFVGMSLRDPNTKRLLKISREIGVRQWHYAIFINETKDNRAQRIKELKEYGVDPIWINNYYEIRKIFKKIKTQQGVEVNYRNFL